LHAVLHYDKTRGGLNISDSKIKMRSVHADQCACKLKPGLIGCPGDKVEWSFGSAIDVEKQAAFSMFAEGLSVSETARELKKPLGTIKTWRTHWSVSRIGQPAQDGSGGPGDSNGTVKPVNLEPDPKELKKREREQKAQEKERIRLEAEAAESAEDQRVICEAMGKIGDSYNQGLPLSRSMLAQLLALDPISKRARRLLVPSTGTLEGFRPWNTVRVGTSNALNFLPQGITELPVAPAKPERAAKKPKSEAA